MFLYFDQLCSLDMLILKIILLNKDDFFFSFHRKYLPINNLFLVIWYIQAHAASAVLNFSENCTPDILTPYLDGIVSKLLVLLQVILYIKLLSHSWCRSYMIILFWNTSFLGSQLLYLLQNGKQMVQEGALTALASVADSSQVFFSIVCYSSWLFVYGWLNWTVMGSVGAFPKILWCRYALPESYLGECYW